MPTERMFLSRLLAAVAVISSIADLRKQSSQKKALDSSYPVSLITIGDHIKKKRLDLSLFQKSSASKKPRSATGKIIDQSQRSLCFPKIIEFLGYVPFELSKETIRDKIKVYRKEHGLSQRKLAKLLGVDQITIRDWGRNKHKPSKKLLERIKPFLIQDSIINIIESIML